MYHYQPKRDTVCDYCGENYYHNHDDAEMRKCVKCHEYAYKNCYSEDGKKEVEISGLCEKCFDEIMEDEDE